MSHSRLAVLLLRVASRIGPTALLEGLHFGTVRLGPSRRNIEGQKLKFFLSQDLFMANFKVRRVPTLLT